MPRAWKTLLEGEETHLVNGKLLAQGSHHSSGSMTVGLSLGWHGEEGDPAVIPVMQHNARGRLRGHWG
jgi:hypothetical protein